MRLAGLIVIGVAVLAIILQILFGGPTYGADKLGIVHNSIFVIASFLVGVGVTLLLVDMNFRRHPKDKTYDRERTPERKPEKIRKR